MVEILIHFKFTLESVKLIVEPNSFNTNKFHKQHKNQCCHTFFIFSAEVSRKHGGLNASGILV